MQHFDLFNTEELLALAALDLEKESLYDGLEKLKYLVKKEVVSDELDSMLGSVYAKLQLFQYAVEHYSALLQRDPSRLHERFQLGMVYREINEFDKAVESWDQVLKVEENYPPVLFHKALLLLTVDDETECKTLLKQLIATADKDNYYVERARGVLDELDITDNLVTPISRKLDEVH
ncbi:TPA: tetratricopeptide repeat protein [Vibrio cholerae]|uniref:tetratricopeptide repeat protein n=1 Tax=Vibrio cholerae TaxID=666 RepID=UPI0004E33E3D|nr:tetratricopeptide repeat protein [Vibrio cholerae]EGQ9391525.1 hypothetical protein [Vibrio cholerae]EGR0538782.1 hypothetical protein [Vibrio cholerae]EGR2311440.1 hypothetical protein [Vibrio cholerae]EGR3954458.1 hypothetical protein [Vibrio cholerae]EGR3989232.1 hypothetical protein [Vibrio cholerae]